MMNFSRSSRIIIKRNSKIDLRIIPSYLSITSCGVMPSFFAFIEIAHRVRRFRKQTKRLFLAISGNGNKYQKAYVNTRQMANEWVRCIGNAAVIVYLLDSVS
jgi:hypothetical protein